MGRKISLQASFKTQSGLVWQISSKRVSLQKRLYIFTVVKKSKTIEYTIPYFGYYDTGTPEDKLLQSLSMTLHLLQCVMEVKYFAELLMFNKKRL